MSINLGSSDVGFKLGAVTPSALHLGGEEVWSAASGAFEAIATATVGAGGAWEMAFSSIPQTYQHLQMRGIVRASTSNASANTQLVFNNWDWGYGSHQMAGQGTTATAGSYNQTSSSIWFQSTIASGSLANSFTGFVVDIFDYASTSKRKVARTSFGWDGNGSGSVGISSVLRDSADAITDIALWNWDGDWTEHSTFALYGIKA